MNEMIAMNGMQDMGFVMELLLIVCGLMVVYGVYRILKAFSRLTDSGIDEPTLEEQMFMLKLQNSISRN